MRWQGRCFEFRQSLRPTVGLQAAAEPGSTQLEHGRRRGQRYLPLGAAYAKPRPKRRQTATFPPSAFLAVC